MIPFVRPSHVIFETSIRCVHLVAARTGIDDPRSVGIVMHLPQVRLQQIGPGIALGTKDAGIRSQTFMLLHMGLQQRRFVEATVANAALEGVSHSSSFSGTQQLARNG